jgi:hypothetical protein
LITVGVERYGLRLSLSHIAGGEWRATFMDDNARLGALRVRRGGDAVRRSEPELDLRASRLMRKEQE